MRTSGSLVSKFRCALYRTQYRRLCRMRRGGKYHHHYSQDRDNRDKLANWQRDGNLWS